jgi:hypothetical protein
VLGQFDSWGEVFHAVADFFERIHFHEFALAAAAGVAGHPHHVINRRAQEFLVRTFLLHAVDDAGFGDDDELLCGIVFAEGDHLFGRADGIGKQPDFAGAFRVNDHFGVRIFFLGAEYGVALEFHMHVTIAFPERHGATGLFHDPLAEIFVGDEQEVFVLGRSIDDLFGIAAGDDDVAERFDSGAAIDVGNGPEIWIGGLQLGEFRGRATFFEGTTGIFVRQHHDFARVQNLRGLSHEMHAAEDDDIGIGFGGLLREPEGIADVIRDVLDFGHLIIVREDDGVELFFERENLLGERLKAVLAHGGPKFEFAQRRRRDSNRFSHRCKLTGAAEGVNCADVVEISRARIPVYCNLHEATRRVARN